MPGVGVVGENRKCVAGAVFCAQHASRGPCTAARCALSHISTLAIYGNSPNTDLGTIFSETSSTAQNAPASGHNRSAYASHVPRLPPTWLRPKG